VDDHHTAALPRAARHCQVDSGSPFGQQIQQNGSTEVAQDCPLAGRKDGSQEAAVERLRLAHREHATMYSYQPTCPNAPRDGVVGVSERNQLSALDHPVLASREMGQVRISS
jgi:hypothetical protein